MEYPRSLIYVVGAVFFISLYYEYWLLAFFVELPLLWLMIHYRGRNHGD